MKEKESDFLTHTQRVGFVSAVFPLTSILLIAAVAVTATNKWACIGVWFLFLSIGIGFLKLGIHFDQQRFFKISSALLNSFNLFLICWFAGPNSPGFLIGITFIGANVLSSTHRGDLLVTLVIALGMISWGSYLTGKKPTEIFMILMVLICVIIILFRLLQFTLFQGREILSANKKIELQKEIIEEKNKELLSSIRYARRIQTSLLPTDRYIGKCIARLKLC
ncbi:MAG: hypothetical protein HY064_14215 [Bacteroidetes bacterium]|nr:hypothetical protein [Bacteroidota bacterium]